MSQTGGKRETGTTQESRNSKQRATLLKRQTHIMKTGTDTNATLEYKSGYTAGSKHATLPKFDQAALETYHTERLKSPHLLEGAYSEGYMDAVTKTARESQQKAERAAQRTNPEINGSYVTPDGKAQIDFGITYRNGYPELTASGHFDGSSGQCIEEIAAAYPQDATVQSLTYWHARYHLKELPAHSTLIMGDIIAQHPARSFYDNQATQFLASNDLKLRATLSDTKVPAWSTDGKHRHHYRVTITSGTRASAWKGGKEGTGVVFRKGGRITFDYWGSINDATQGKAPTPYDVLACISGDAYTPETFEDFCAEYGESPDSLTALQTFRRCNAFARRLRAFFTPAELEQLSEIQ